MRAKERNRPQERSLKADSGEASFRNLLPCFPCEMTPIGNKLLQRINKSLHEPKQRTICTSSTIITPKKINRSCFLFSSCRVPKRNRRKIIWRIKYLVLQHVRWRRRDRQASILFLLLYEIVLDHYGTKKTLKADDTNEVINIFVVSGAKFSKVGAVTNFYRTKVFIVLLRTR